MILAKDIAKISDFFCKKEDREKDTVYKAVLKSYDNNIHELLYKYYTDATKCGLIIEDKLANPLNDQVLYLNNTISSNFEMSKDFIKGKLQKWLQNLNNIQLSILSESMYTTFEDLRKEGKNDSVLRNAYMKFMCWLYYRCRSVLVHIGTNKIPKILYEGNITVYELYMLDILGKCGCDILILDYGIEDKVKLEKSFPKYIEGENSTFPSDFSIKRLREEFSNNQKLIAICGNESNYILCRNAWMSDTDVSEIKRVNRSEDNKLICSTFVRYKGVKDRNTYISDLYNLYKDISDAKREVKIIEGNIQSPTPIEVNVLHRITCKNISDIIAMTMNNIILKDIELRNYAKHLFYKYIMEQRDESIHKIEVKVLKLLIIFNRYSVLFNMKNQGCLFVLENKSLTDVEYSYLDFLSNFPLDIVIFNPNKVDSKGTSNLLEFEEDTRLKVDKFPTTRVDNSYSTTAYNANNDLNTILYQDTGLYRNKQYKKADTVILKTIYDEIEILWNEDISMRQGFSTNNDVVTVPTIFAKICGVKDGNKKQYIKSIEKLVVGNDNVLYYKDRIPISVFERSNVSERYNLGQVVGAMMGTQQQQSVPLNIASVLTNGNIDIEKIRNHNSFKYNYMREEILYYMVDKLNDLLKSNIIEGIGNHGVENILLNVFFNIPKEILDMIQKFDFCKVNPKIVYVNTGENILSIEETILLQYLSFIGFDIVMFVPTGYSVIEKYFIKKLYTEYELGEYMFNLKIDIKKKKGFFF